MVQYCGKMGKKEIKNVNEKLLTSSLLAMSCGRKPTDCQSKSMRNLARKEESSSAETTMKDQSKSMRSTRRGEAAEAGEMKDLGTLGGWAAEACSINSNGIVVGWSSPAPGVAVTASP